MFLPRLPASRALLLGSALCLGPLLGGCQLDQLSLPGAPESGSSAGAATAVPAATGDAALDKMMQVAERTRQLGDPAMAVQLYRRAAASHPERPEPAVALGDTLLALDEPAAAAQAYRAALGNVAGYEPAVLGLGKALLRQDQPLAALQVYEAFLADHPGHARALSGAGVAAGQAGDHAQAQDLFRRGLLGAPEDGSLLNNLGYSLVLSADYDAAVAVLERAAARPGADRTTRQNLALAYGLSGREAEAARTLRTDWDEAAVADNLAWYRQQRQLGAQPGAKPPALAQ